MNTPTTYRHHATTPKNSARQITEILKTGEKQTETPKEISKNRQYRGFYDDIEILKEIERRIADVFEIKT